MSRDSVIAECNDYLLGAGVEDAMVNLYPQALRDMGISLPIWTAARVIDNAWTYLTLFPDGTTTDLTTPAKTTGVVFMDMATILEGHLIGGTALYDTVTYTITTPFPPRLYVASFDYWTLQGWVPLTLAKTPDFRVLGAQTLQMVFIPDDWVRGAPTTDVTLPAAVDPNQYWIRVRLESARLLGFGQQSIESVSQAHFLTIQPKGVHKNDSYQGSDLYAGILAGTLPVNVGRGRASIESVSQAPFLTVEPLGNHKDDFAQSLGLYRGVFAFGPNPHILTPDPIAFGTVAVNLHTFFLNPDDLALLALVVYPNEVTPVGVAASLELVVPDWRTEVGTPRVYTQAEQTTLAVRLIPAPANQGQPGGLFLQGLGGDGTNTIVTFSVVPPQETDVPEWLEGILALRLAAMEARRQGESTSAELAQALLGLVGELEHMVHEPMHWEKEGVS